MMRISQPSNQDGTDSSMPGVPTGDVLFFGRWWERRHTAIAVVTLLCIVAYLVMAYGLAVPASISRWSLWIALAVCGGPLVFELALRLFAGQFGSDLLA